MQLKIDPNSFDQDVADELIMTEDQIQTKHDKEWEKFIKENEVQKDFDPEKHPRDDHGRFSGGESDGISGSGPEAALKEIDSLPENPLDSHEHLIHDSEGNPIALVDASINTETGRLRLHSLRSVVKGQGYGSKALKYITDIADRTKTTLELTSSPFGPEPRLDHEQLHAFYERHGFIDEPGYDLAYGYMIREPKSHDFTVPQNVQENAKKIQGVQNEKIESLRKRLISGEKISIGEIRLLYSNLLTMAPEQRFAKSWSPEWMALGGRPAFNWSSRVLKNFDPDIVVFNKAMELNAEVTKIDSQKRLVFGWASITSENGSPIIDKQGDIISDDEIENAAYDFVLNARIAGEMHDRVGVGKLIESIVFTKEKQKALGIDIGKTGWFLGFKITDDDVWKKVQSGQYKMFSIHGKGKRKEL